MDCSTHLLGVREPNSHCGKTIPRVQHLAKEFASNVPELKFSPAKIFSFLMEHRKSPEEAIGNVEKLISKPIKAKSKPLTISEDTKRKDTQPEIARDSKWDKESLVTEVPTEMVQTPLASEQPTALPGSPIISPSKHFLNLIGFPSPTPAVSTPQAVSSSSSLASRHNLIRKGLYALTIMKMYRSTSSVVRRLTSSPASSSSLRLKPRLKSASYPYYRMLFYSYFYLGSRYKSASLPTIRTIGPKDVIMILPTVLVLEADNPDFKECLTTCLINKPTRVIIVTNTDFKATETRLTMFLDDHVFLPYLFLDSVVPVFENPCVGLCGTKKAVRRALYLERHNFEIRATNAMDRGVFVVSGRALVILSEIV
ncbi:hypothetical protein G7Y89_g11446 [Cudoniella acicularis]|uniref:Mitochondrial chaperone BCS1-like ATPase lid domain-containing protein n=1 Tax=Cudoniella acicularis TaxID=354080 RepID=A0A8H4RBY2_9HELO|nr:hypothetical protein G7Y89_g11446 [Cudoniella acicularis]